MKIAITGHRPERLRHQEEQIKNWFIEQFKKYNPSCIYCGMAHGVDQTAALAAKYLGIPIKCCYPFKRTHFSPTEEYIINGNEIIYTNEKYSKQSYYIRDKYMVDNADMLLAVWDKIPNGGTYLTIDYAKKKNMPIIEYTIERN